jgi:hypothetical protein
MNVWDCSAFAEVHVTESSEDGDARMSGLLHAILRVRGVMFDVLLSIGWR